MKPKMIPLNIPVPPAPILEQAVGYPDEDGARFLSLWWECADDEVFLSDAVKITSGNWEGYLAYVHHKAVYPHLTSYNLGSSHELAKYHLLIDLIERLAYVASGRDAERIMIANMRREADEIEKMILSDEDEKALIKAFLEGLQETPEDDELPPSMEEERQAVMNLTRWLDDQLK
jgi:hypothetical protein